jgi:branched-chain amino acid transport system permease protein
MFLPVYRGWVVVASLAVCLATWFVIERTKLGAYLRAATENPILARAFGINVPRMVTLACGFGVALAAFAMVVIGGMGSILGSIVAGSGLGIVKGLAKVCYPETSSTVIFMPMAIVLLLPAGLFGRTA